jgi:prevent-host-death family protein
VATVNIHEAKTHLSRLLERAQAGEHIVIAKAGVPVAELTPIRPGRLRLGLYQGKLDIDWEAFDTLDDEIARMFYGDPGLDDPA